ncbi:MAG: hypothetical protein KW793_03520 [Candidatus Doudnabacteria bacterium]|nr:hypothetical protein [Candidatus Doudnabacteria bacterium]
MWNPVSQDAEVQEYSVLTEDGHLLVLFGKDVVAVDNCYRQVLLGDAVVIDTRVQASTYHRSFGVGRVVEIKTPYEVDLSNEIVLVKFREADIPIRMKVRELIRIPDYPWPDF